MTKFRKLQLQALRHNIILEKVQGQFPYEMYRNDDHSTTAICHNLKDVEQEMPSMMKKSLTFLKK